MQNLDLRWPSRIILSRKGCDSSTGQCASPIFGDASMVSIPISDRGTGISFRSVAYSSPCGTTLADILPSIGCHLEASEEVHLDPDLRKESREKRAEGWRPMFGQCGG